jgi:large subunit ribosomal protein L21
LGNPVVPGAKVMASVVSHGRGKKIIVFRYKPKTRYRKKTGHRQLYTRVAVQSIALE